MESSRRAQKPEAISRNLFLNNLQCKNLELAQLNRDIIDLENPRETQRKIDEDDVLIFQRILEKQKFFEESLTRRILLSLPHIRNSHDPEEQGQNPIMEYNKDEYQFNCVKCSEKQLKALDRDYQIQ